MKVQALSWQGRCPFAYTFNHPIMAPTPKPRHEKSSSDWIVPAAAVATVFVMLVPVPSFVLDILLSFSITASVLVLLVSMYILQPVDFSVFPSLLLLLTLFRLVAQSGQQPPHSAARERRLGRRRARDRGLRPIRGGRQLRGRASCCSLP